MTDRLRRAGSGLDAEGLWVVWSVAEGKRGRRWREVRSHDSGVASSLLLETDPEGRFTHLELSTSAGLLTLHPEDDGTLHGNLVTPKGVEHVRGLRWDAERLVLLEGSIVCQAAAAELLRGRSAFGSSESRPAVVVPRTLRLEAAQVHVERITGAEWRFGDRPPIRLDDRGLPQLHEGESWPLEE
jgi:hypothetical protein